MTEPDDQRTTQALRDMLSDRISTLNPPADVYETVRRRHRRQQRTIVGSALVLALAAVAVPAVALSDRPPTPTATGPHCSFAGGPAPLTADRLPAQRDVPGSLGGDAQLVSAVLAQGWAGLRAQDSTRLLDPGTAKVLMVEQVEGQIIAIVAADGLGRRVINETWVWGSDAEHLGTYPSGAVNAPSPVRTPYAIGNVFLEGLKICGSRYVVVATAPGTTGRMRWISAITPQLRAVERTQVLPIRADGIAVFRSDAEDPRIRLERAGRVVFEGGLPSRDIGLKSPTEQDIQRIVAEAPGNGSRSLVRTIVDMSLLATELPVQPSGQRVLWTGRAGRATVAISVCTLPGGVRYVATGAAIAVNSLLDDRYRGLLVPGTLEHTVLAWPITQAADALAVYAAGGVRAEAVLADGGAVLFALSDGGGVLQSTATVRRVRVYDADNRLIGEQVPGEGLSELPHVNPI